MSSFTCEKCGADILDSPDGYVSGCEHYPLEGNKYDKGVTMSIIKCVCGHETNTACSDWLDTPDWQSASGCYARIIDGKWVKGCKYKGASMFDKQFADRILGDRKSFRKKRQNDFNR